MLPLFACYAKKLVIYQMKVYKVYCYIDLIAIAFFKDINNIFKQYCGNKFPRQRLKRFIFRIKSSDLIFFLRSFSPVVN